MILLTQKYYADLDEVLNSMMERMADTRWRCLNCAKTMANSTLMRRHCEIHLDCSHTCNVCGKKAKTRNALEIHTRRYHGNGVGINKGIRDAGSTADIRMLWPWSALVCLGLL